MAEFQLHYDPDIWLRVPVEFPDDEDDRVEHWAARQAGEQRARGFRETADSGTLEQYFLDLVDVARAAGEHESLWAIVATDAPALVVLTLDAIEAVGSLDGVLSQLAAPTVSQYEPVQHTSTYAKELGEGVRFSRLDVDAEGHVYQSQFFAFRHGRTDYVLSTQHYDVPALAWAESAIRDFIDGIEPMEAP